MPARPGVMAYPTPFAIARSYGETLYVTFVAPRFPAIVTMASPSAAYATVTRLQHDGLTLKLIGAADNVADALGEGAADVGVGCGKLGDFAALGVGDGDGLAFGGGAAVIPADAVGLVVDVGTGVGGALGVELGGALLGVEAGGCDGWLVAVALGDVLGDGVVDALGNVGDV